MPKQIMVATVHQGLWGGTVPTNQNMGESTMTLTECRLADEWGAQDDMHRLATIGPGPKASISLPATVTIQGIVTATLITPEAWVKWKDANWTPLKDRQRG